MQLRQCGSWLAGACSCRSKLRTIFFSPALRDKGQSSYVGVQIIRSCKGNLRYRVDCTSPAAEPNSAVNIAERTYLTFLHCIQTLRFPGRFATPQVVILRAEHRGMGANACVTRDSLAKRNRFRNWNPAFPPMNRHVYSTIRQSRFRIARKALPCGRTRLTV